MINKNSNLGFCNQADSDSDSGILIGSWFLEGQRWSVQTTLSQHAPGEMMWSFQGSQRMTPNYLSTPLTIAQGSHLSAVKCRYERYTE